MTPIRARIFAPLALLAPLALSALVALATAACSSAPGADPWESVPPPPDPVATPGPPSKTPFFAGVAVEDITPCTREFALSTPAFCKSAIPLAARFIATTHGPPRADGIEHPLTTRALALADAEGNHLVLVTVDLLALDRSFLDDIRQRVAVNRGLRVEEILINLGHTHSAPVPRHRVLATKDPAKQHPNPQYLDAVRARITRVIERAVDARAPAALRFGRGLANVGAYRRIDGFEPPPYDPTLDVLEATDEAGRVSAIVVFHGVHPVTMMGSARVSPDFIGPLRDVLEAAHPTATALFFQGFAGDINPRWWLHTACSSDLQCYPGVKCVSERCANTREQHMQTIGGTLAAETLPILARLSTDGLVLRPPIHSSSRVTFLPLVGGTFLPTEIASARIAVADDAHPWRLLASAHEVVADYAPLIRARHPGSRVTLAGYTNACDSYLPNRRIIDTDADGRPLPQRSRYEGFHSFFLHGLAPPTWTDADFVYAAGWGD